MKKMSKKDNVGRMSTNYPLLNSDLTLTRPLRAYRGMVYTFAVFAMLFLGGWNTPAWGGEQTFYAKITVISEPSIGGYVYIAQSAQSESAAADNKKTEDSSSPSYKNTWITSLGRMSSYTFDLYGYQSAKTGFAFKGWATSQSANSGTTTTSSSWGKDYYPFSITSTSTNSSKPTSATYYAIFAGIVNDDDNKPTA